MKLLLQFRSRAMCGCRDTGPLRMDGMSGTPVDGPTHLTVEQRGAIRDGDMKATAGATTREVGIGMIIMITTVTDMPTDITNKMCFLN